MSRPPDTLVIGSGIAGLSFALETARGGRRVLVITKKDAAESNTNYAQGGIAAALGPDDDPALHVEDTLRAGAGLCDRAAVEAIAREGPALVRELAALGARFAEAGGTLDLGMEGGHSRRRIVHATDATGREVERALLAAAAAAGVEIAAHLFAVDLVVEGGRCLGVVVLDEERDRLRTIGARDVLLATGGAGRVYLHTTNPAIATGDGVAMARRAGAAIEGMEFVQFHPTVFAPDDGAPPFLVTEAMRGEGARLTTPEGRPFMRDFDDRGDLAPRDVVARAIDRLMKTHDWPHVLLDARPVGRARLEARFPTVTAHLRGRGVDPANEPIPVVPAAHYFCGGVRTDLHGETSIARLWAAGECAWTGVHGANRLASNSLLEALVFARRAARRVLEGGAGGAPPTTPLRLPQPEGRPVCGLVPLYEDHLRRVMWEAAGIVRTRAGLERARAEVEEMRRGVERLHRIFAPRRELLELRNLVEVASLVVEAALGRRESVGLHYVVG